MTYAIEYEQNGETVRDWGVTTRKAAESYARRLSNALNELVYVVVFPDQGAAVGHKSFYCGAVSETSGDYA